MSIHDTLLLLEDCNLLSKLHKLKLQFEVNSENRATMEAVIEFNYRASTQSVYAI